jgi:ferredoxin-NADP reductase
VAGAAVLGRLTWQVADVIAVREETATARTLVLEVPGWSGHLPGQHVDLRLTAADGYSVQRSYSVANAPHGRRVELTVQRVAGGEVSPYLVEEVRAGDRLELRGPVGGYFLWRPEWTSPVLLLAGGSGVVPLAAIVRTRAATQSRARMHLIYSARSPADVLYAAELRQRAAEDAGLAVAFAFTRTPASAGARTGRVDAAFLAAAAGPILASDPRCYVCGPTRFVEAMADLLVAAGQAPDRIRTERFG